MKIVLFLAINSKVWVYGFLKGFCNFKKPSKGVEDNPIATKYFKLLTCNSRTRMMLDR